MAITSSAKKAIRSSARKRVFNLRHKKAVQEVLKKIENLAVAKKLDDAIKLVPSAYKAIDKAVKTKFLKKNTGARMKSRLMKFLHKKKS